MADPSEILRVAVLGAGSIGSAWAIVFARAGHKVTLYDPDPDRPAAARREVDGRLADLVSFSLLDEEPDAVGSRIAIVSTLDEALAGADWVQECAPESLALKQSLFADLIRRTGARTILASSSSALRMSQIVTEPALRGRCLVVHPGNPPYLLPIAELVPAPGTDAAAITRAEQFLRSAGMVPIVLRKEVEGFVFNRLQGAVLREAYCLVRDGVVEAADIDRVVREGLGLRWSIIGPFETADLNTRGGIAAHADRMGPAYARMGAERGQNDPWAPDLVARVAGERRRALPLDRWAERCLWRDRMLMVLSKAKRQALDRFGR